MRNEDRDAIERFLGQGIHWDYLFSRWSEQLAEVEDPLRGAVGEALGYMLSDKPDGGPQGYGAFGPILQFDDRVSARPFGSLPAEVLEAWADVADSVQHPMAQARFNDLLWSARHGTRVDLRARAAIAAYRAVARGGEWALIKEPEPEDGTGAHSMGSFRRSQCYRRALRIALELRDKETVDGLAEELLACAREAAEPLNPGTFFILIEGLVQLPANHRPKGLEELVEATWRTATEHIHNFERLASILAALVGTTRKRAIWHDVIERWMSYSRNADPFERRFAIQHAAELAREHGLSGDLGEIRREFDRLPKGNEGFSSISVPVDIPAKELDEYLNTFVNVPTWQEALDAWAMSGGSPPTGNTEQHQALADELRATAPLQFLIPVTIVDEEGRPVFRAEGPDQHNARIIRQQRSIGISLWANWSHEILRRLIENLSRPTQEELIDWFLSPLVPTERSEAFARAFEHYFEGRWDESAHIITPRIEASLRELARQLGVPVFREGVGDEIGGVATLGTILNGLKGRLPDPWLEYLIHALTDPLGKNLRNRISHGLITSVGADEAVILLHIGCFLRQLRFEPTDKGESASGDA